MKAMKDNLEKYIIENREAFNDADPNPLMWLEIEKKLEKKGKVKIRKMTRVFAIAASFIIILGAGVLIGLNITNNNSSTFPADNPQYVEFQEAENYFQKQVSVKMDQLKEKNVEQDVQDDLTQLDAVYNEMKAELLNSPTKDNSAIIQAMIDNYRIRIDMLEKILNNVNDKNKENEDDNITI